MTVLVLCISTTRRERTHRATFREPIGSGTAVVSTTGLASSTLASLVVLPFSSGASSFALGSEVSDASGVAVDSSLSFVFLSAGSKPLSPSGTDNRSSLA